MMGLRARLLAAVFPGACLIIVAGLLIDTAARTFAVFLGFFGFLVLVMWPIIALTVQIRHESRSSRGREISTLLGRSYVLVTAVQKFALQIGIPVVMLGGVGIFCLITAGDEPDQRVAKIVFGFGALLLLAVYLLLLLLGRSALTLRLAGIACVVFGAGALFTVITEVQDGSVVPADIIAAGAGIVVSAAGLWLLVTGRNSIKRRG